jgi:glutamate-1-semialdehyde 2,1-aminomutase
MTAGLATLEILSEPGLWEQLTAATTELVNGFAQAAEQVGIPVYSNRVGTMFSTFFTAGPVFDWNSVKECDTVRFGRFFRAMLENGVYLAPSQFEAGFMSTAHSPEIVTETLQAAEKSLKTLL